MRPAWVSALLWAIFAVVIANYAAQVPYYLRLYYFPRHAPPALFGTLALAVTLAWFLAGFALLLRGRMVGYWLTLSFLVTETTFYLYNMVNQVAHGYALFFHLANPDPILWTVFAIGYLNMLAGIVFVAALALAGPRHPAPSRRKWREPAVSQPARVTAPSAGLGVRAADASQSRRARAERGCEAHRSPRA